MAASVIGRVLPVALILGHRLAYWAFTNQTRIEFYYTLSAGALAFVEASSNLLLNNVDPVEMANNNPGDWVEKQVGANMTDYEVIDDFRDGNVTSIKTNQQSMERLTAAITKEAETLGSRSQDFQPRNSAPASVKPIPISTVQTRTVLFTIPETNAGFLRDSTFIQAVRQIQQSTKVIVRVVPIRGWKK
jgi:hypothetical protein